MGTPCRVLVEKSPSWHYIEYVSAVFRAHVFASIHLMVSLFQVSDRLRGMATLVVAEHSNGALGKGTLSSLTAAAFLREPIHVLVAGVDVNGVALAAAKQEGVSKVLVAESSALDHNLAEPYSFLLFNLMSRHAV